ncbi:MAG: hypothetical protein ACFFAO_15160, partial [Candidatus Hermodarchaeota archaeon]
MSPNLTNKERLLNTFEKKKIDKIVFSPRLYYWYGGNKLYTKKTSNDQLSSNIPERFLNKTQLEIYDLLQASPRYSEETLNLPLIKTKINSKAGINLITQKGAKEGETITKYKTPLGNLTEKMAIGAGFGIHYTEFPIKTVEDMKIMRYIFENTEFVFLDRNYKKAEAILGDRGVVSTYLYSSPYQRLVKELMGFVNTVLLLKRKPNEMENFMLFLERWDDKMYDIIAKSPLEIINFGENIDANLSPPPQFEKYLMPYYERRVKQLHQAG